MFRLRLLGFAADPFLLSIQSFVEVHLHVFVVDEPRGGFLLIRHCFRVVYEVDLVFDLDLLLDYVALDIELLSQLLDELLLSIVSFGSIYGHAISLSFASDGRSVSDEAVQVYLLILIREMRLNLLLDAFHFR